MGNTTLDLLNKRKSVRIYTDKLISEEDRRRIFTAAAMAPTAGNQQLYTILDIKDQGLKESLVETCDNQDFIAKAKMVLIFCADCKKWYDAYTLANANPRNPGLGDFLLAVNDAMVAAQNAVIAAESLGIGSCYIGDVMENYEIHRELLQLPQWVFPATMVVFGYPTYGQKERKKPRRQKIEDFVFENTYPKESVEAIQEKFQNLAQGEDYKSWLQKFCQRKYHSDFAQELNRSVESFLRSLDGGEA